MKYIITLVLTSAFFLSAFCLSAAEEKKVNPFTTVNLKIKQLEAVFATLTEKKKGSYSKRLEKEYSKKAKLKDRLEKPFYAKINKLKQKIKKTTDAALLTELNKQLDEANAGLREIGQMANEVPKDPEKK